MDFNSNDEYLKAFPPNFGPKLEGCNMLNQVTVHDFQVQRLLPENQQDNIEEIYMKQMLKPGCLSEELQVQEPIQVLMPVSGTKNKGDGMLKAHELVALCEEDLAPAREKSSFAELKIIEPMPQVVDMTVPVMEVQRDNEMALGGESDGEPSVETALPSQAIETRVFDDGETFVSDDVEVDEPPFAIETMREATMHCEMIPAEEDVITIGGIKDAVVGLNNIGHYGGEKSVVEEAMGRVATEKEETSVGFVPPLREFVEGTQIFVEQERPLSSDIDTEEGNTMEVTEPLQDAQNGQPADGSTLGRIAIEFREETMTTRLETSENADAIAAIESNEPGALEMIETTTTTIRATYETQNSENERTQIEESEVLGTEVAATMALEITEKTTVKAKVVCPFEGEEEEAPFAIARNGVPGASNSTTGFEDLGTCSEAEVDKIVDSIMNDIADIEADMEVENEDVENAEVEDEADMESNTQHRKLEISGKSVGVENTAMCPDYIQSTGSHV